MRVEGQVADVDAADRRTGAGVDVVEAGDERGDGGLAAARRADQGHELARLDAERDAVEDLDAAAGVERGDLLERRQRDLVGRRVGEAHVRRARPTPGRRAPRRRRALSAISGSRSSTSNTRSKLDERGHGVDPGAGQRGERARRAG